MFKIKVWKGNSKELGFLKINEQGWSEVDENDGTVFILGVSEQGLKMCGEKRVEAGRLYIQVAANQKHFRYYLSGGGSYKGFKCGAYSSADSASFFKFEKQKLVADSWDYLKDTVLAYDEEKNTLVFADPKAENTVDVVFQQVKLVPTEDSNKDAQK